MAVTATRRWCIVPNSIFPAIASPATLSADRNSHRGPPPAVIIGAIGCEEEQLVGGPGFEPGGLTVPNSRRSRPPRSFSAVLNSTEITADADWACLEPLQSFGLLHELLHTKTRSSFLEMGPLNASAHVKQFFTSSPQ